MDISHPGFWKNQNDAHPAPMTSISYEDVKNEKWIPVAFKDETISYVKALENNGEFGHVIWPEHCIMGTKGAAIVHNIMDAVINWARSGKYFYMVRKGSNPLTEHFGVFRANVPIPGKPETQKNKQLLNDLNEFSEIFIAGEAKSHCVANTLKQLFDYPYLLRKITVLENCMSNIQGFEEVSDTIFEEAKRLGVRMVRSEEFVAT
jgi:nicotinamidase-related amidase